MTTRELITTLEDIFATTRIVAFERYNFICRKQKKTESLEEFHADLVELASRADCGDRADEWVPEMFTAHMQIDNLAEELLAQTKSRKDAFEYAIRREKVIKHSRTMKTNPFGNQVTATKQEPVYYINTQERSNIANNQVPQRGRGNFRGLVYPRGQQNTRGQSQQQRNQYPNTQKRCFKCGNKFGQNHLQSCPAKDKICSKCAKWGHFAKVCRSGTVNYPGQRIDEGEQEETESESQGTEPDPVAFADFTSKNGWEVYQVDNFSVMAISEAFEIKHATNLSEDDLNGHIIKLKTKTEELFAIADSGSPMSFLNEKKCRPVVKTE